MFLYPHIAARSPGSLKRSVRYVLFTLFAVIAVSAPNSAQYSDVPLDRQVSMMLKVMDSDSHITSGYPCCNVGILYSHHDSSSVAEKNFIMQYAADHPNVLLDGTPVHFVPIDLEHDGGWKHILSSDSIATVIITSISQRYLEPVTTVCRERAILSMTTVPDFVPEGVSVGVSSQNDRTVLMINLPVSLAEGARISSRVLKMAKIYR